MKNLLEKITPNWFRKIDYYLLTNNSFLWEIRVHYLILIILTQTIISTVIGLLYPIKFPKSIPDFYDIYVIAFIIQFLFLLVFLYNLYISFRNKNSNISGYFKMICIYGGFVIFQIFTVHLLPIIVSSRIYNPTLMNQIQPIRAKIRFYKDFETATEKILYMNTESNKKAFFFGSNEFYGYSRNESYGYPRLETGLNDGIFIKRPRNPYSYDSELAINEMVENKKDLNDFILQFKKYFDSSVDSLFKTSTLKYNISDTDIIILRYINNKLIKYDSYSDEVLPTDTNYYSNELFLKNYLKNTNVNEQDLNYKSGIDFLIKRDKEVNDYFIKYDIIDIKDELTPSLINYIIHNKNYYKSKKYNSKFLIIYKNQKFSIVILITYLIILFFFINIEFTSFKFSLLTAIFSTCLMASLLIILASLGNELISSADVPLLVLIINYIIMSFSIISSKNKIIHLDYYYSSSFFLLWFYLLGVIYISYVNYMYNVKIFDARISNLFGLYLRHSSIITIMLLMMTIVSITITHYFVLSKTINQPKK